MPGNSKSRRKSKLEPISYEEMLGSAGMSGFVSFLDVKPQQTTQLPHLTVRDSGTARDSSTELGTHTEGDSSTVWKRPGERIYRARTAQDGHSLGEQILYQAMWSAATPESDDARILRAGYDRLAHLSRLNWTSVKQNLRALIKKLALEIIALENSNDRIGRTYRIYSEAAILRRRQAAGMEWVRRTRGVEFVPSPVMESHTV